MQMFETAWSLWGGLLYIQTLVAQSSDVKHSVETVAVSTLTVT